MEIAILGGGVAGVSSAIALKQKGFDVKVYERGEAASNIGAGIVVWPNAAYVLEQLGVLDEIRAVSGAPKRMHRVSNAMDELGSIDIELINRYMGYPSCSIFRSEFQNILISKLESHGIAILYDHEVVNIATNNAGTADIYFSNGKKISPELIVGADGRMASCARSYVYGDNAPVYQGFINWIGVVDSAAKLFDEIDIVDYWGVGARFGIVPVTEQKAYWAGAISCPEVGKKNPAEYKDELFSLFANWPEPVWTVIEKTPVDKINKIYVHDHNPVNTWHKNNVVMIGDAAHAPLPTSGQGACQALEDAWHLARYLKNSRHDIQAAFSAFTRERFEKTTGITMAARSLASSLFSRDEAFCMARNDHSKNTDYLEVARGMSRAWSQHLPLSA